MKVLLINGSPRHKGNTNVALEEIAQQLEKHGISSEIIWIGNKPVRGCIGCAKCRANGNNLCVFNDDPCNTVIQKMKECDALVIGSPVYFGQPTGQVLCLDRKSVV